MRNPPRQLSHTGWFNIAVKPLSCNKDRFNNKHNLIGCWLAVLCSWSLSPSQHVVLVLHSHSFLSFSTPFSSFWRTRHTWTAWTPTLTFSLSLTQILPGQELHEPQLASTKPQLKPWPVAPTQEVVLRLFSRYHNRLLKGVHVLDLWQQQRVRRPCVKITSEGWNSWMTLPCAFGLDDFYRQMRMSGSIKTLHNHTGFKPWGGFQRRRKCF